MVPYRKYILLWQRFENGTVHCRLVDLGLVKENHKPIITPSTYCYQIIFSQLGLEDLSCDEFFESQELRNSVSNYIGEEYRYNEFHKKYPNQKADAAKLNPNYFRIVVAHPISSDANIFETVYTYGRHKTYSKEDVLSYIQVISPEELSKNYKFYLFF